MEVLTAEVEGYFAGLKESHFRDGIKALEHHWNKCISQQGDYVEFHQGKTLLSSIF